MALVFSAVGFGILSGVTTILSGYETNRRLRSSYPNDTYAKGSRPYRNSFMLWCLIVSIVAVSCLLGYFAAKKEMHWIAVVELAGGYLAVLAAGIIDLKTRTIPNFIPLGLVLIRLVMAVLEFIYVDNTINHLISSLVGGLLCMVLLVVANKLSKGGIGAGDIKLLSALGFVCGIYMVLSVILFSLIGFILVSSILLLTKKCTLKDQVPFGPFIYVGFLVHCLMTLY